MSDVTVVVEEASDLSQTTNYSYSLSHVSGRDAAVAVFAASPFGVGYAMESLLQLASPKARLDCAGFQLRTRLFTITEGCCSTRAVVSTRWSW